MRRNDVLELAERLSPYEIESVKKTDGVYTLEVKAENEDGIHIYEICRSLNGYDKTDYFSVLGIETIGATKYKAKVVRVTISEE